MLGRLTQEEDVSHSPELFQQILEDEVVYRVLCSQDLIAGESPFLLRSAFVSESLFGQRFTKVNRSWSWWRDSLLESSLWI